MRLSGCVTFVGMSRGAVVLKLSHDQALVEILMPDYAQRLGAARGRPPETLGEFDPMTDDDRQRGW
ncbi:hypothetical protein [Micromonospora sp. IBHARD004]|uniref:hypothetical protein n=1 Tax=Micromonospora sp. IBHARD004 TaxID=3457764 RepID=UPI00405A2DB8